MYILQYNVLVYIIFSKILKNVGSKNMGLQFDMTALSPYFLHIGIISEYFNRVQNVILWFLLEKSLVCNQMK
jgi:hypothetical protein